MREAIKIVCRDRLLDIFDVVGHSLIEGDDITGFYLQFLSGREGKVHEVTTCVNESHAGSGKPFEDESFAAEESRAELLDQRNGQLSGRLREKKRISLRQDALPRSQLKRLNAARIAAGEPDFPWTVGAEISHKQRLPRDSAAKSAE